MRNVITVVALIVFATSLAARNTDPIVPVIAEAFETPLSRVVLLSTAFGIPFALIQPLLGAIADMVGKTRLMVICLLIMTVSALVCAVAPNFETMVVGRVIAGLAAGGVYPMSAAVTADLTPADRRQVVYARIVIAGMTGNMLGASLAGVVADLAGWRAVFISTTFIAAASLVAAVLAFRQTRIDKPTAFDLSSLGPNFRAIVRNPLAKICYGAVFLEGVLVQGFFPFVAVLLLLGGETRSSIAGFVVGGFGLGALIYGATVSWILRHLGERGSMVVGAATVAIMLFLMALQLPWPVQIAVFTVLGFGFFLLHGVIQIYAMDLAPRARTTALSLHSAFNFVGQSMGPIYYGFCFALMGPTATLALSGVGFALVGVLCVLRLRRPPPEAA